MAGKQQHRYGTAARLCALLAVAFGMMALRRVSKHKRAVDSVKADIHAIARKPRPAPPVES